MEVEKNFAKRSENDLERTYLLFKDKFKKLSDKQAYEVRELTKKHDEEFNEFYEEVKSALTDEEMDFIEQKMKSEEKKETREIIHEVAMCVYEALKELDEDDN